MIKKLIIAVLALGGWGMAHAAGPQKSAFFQVELRAVSGTLKGQLVVGDLRPPGSRAYFLWTLPNGSNSLELATARWEADGQTLRLHVNEARSLSTGFAPCDYSAVYDPQSSMLNAGRKWPHDNPQLLSAWSGRPIPGGLDKLDEEGNAWLSAPTDLDRLLRELTDSYKLGNVHVHHFPSPQELSALMNARDPEVATAAKTAVGVGAVFKFVSEKLDFTPEERQFNEEMAEFALSSLLGNANSLSQQFFSSNGALSTMLEKRRQAMEYGPDTQNLINEERRRFTSLLQSHAKTGLAPGQVTMHFSLGDSASGHITPRSRGFLVFVNNGNTTLHGVNLTFELIRDPRRIDATWQQEQNDWANAGLLNAMVGIAAEINANGHRAVELQFELLKVGVTGMAYVEAWPPRTPVEIYLDSLGSLERFATQVTGTVTAREGKITLPPVAGVSMVTVIKNAVISQGGFVPR